MQMDGKWSWQGNKSVTLFMQKRKLWISLALNWGEQAGSHISQEISPQVSFDTAVGIKSEFFVEWIAINKNHCLAAAVRYNNKLEKIKQGCPERCLSQSDADGANLAFVIGKCNSKIERRQFERDPYISLVSH